MHRIGRYLQQGMPYLYFIISIVKKALEIKINTIHAVDDNFFYG